MPSELQVPRAGATSRAWYASSIADFLSSGPDEVLGLLARNSTFSVEMTQRDAWLGEISFLREELRGLIGSIFFEFSIPRMGRRIDVVLLLGNVLFVVEFKVGAITVDRAALDQVWDYALDLKNFHQASHHLPIVPIALASAAIDVQPFQLLADDDDVYRPVAATPATFRAVVEAALLRLCDGEVDAQQWHAAPYRPTPTIVEAARA